MAPPSRLHPAPTAAPAPVDVRVSAVLEVISGTPPAEVAANRGVETVLLQRWVSAFIEAGTARVTNQPEPELAGQRDRFLAGFAHELRTPLTVAQGWLMMLADDDLPPSMTVSTAAKLEVALGAVASCVRGMEYLAAASLGRLVVSPHPTSPAALAQQAGLELSGEQHHGVEIVTDSELAARSLADLWLAADSVPAPRSRRLVAVVDGDWLELRVEREADPIDVRVLRAMFEPFDDNDDGTGVSVGLYLARALAVALGGTIGLEQTPAGAGFSLRLPLTHTRRNP